MMINLNKPRLTERNDANVSSWLTQISNHDLRNAFYVISARLQELENAIEDGEFEQVVHAYVINCGNPICGKCSNCGDDVNFKWHRCSNCGAKMDLEDGK